MTDDGKSITNGLSIAAAVGVYVWTICGLWPLVIRKARALDPQQLVLSILLILSTLIINSCMSSTGQPTPSVPVIDLSIPPISETELVTPTPTPAEFTAVVAWFGYVVSMPGGAQFDDFVAILPEGQVGEFGIAGINESIEAEIVALRDHKEPGKYANFWGTLRCDAIDYGGCQLLVSRIRSGTDITDPEPVEGWQGKIYSNEPGAQFSQYFVLDGNYPVRYGIASYIAENGVPIYEQELQNLRDTGQTIRVSGQLICGVPDVNACQIQVSDIE
jgi:hypothetical protein